MSGVFNIATSRRGLISIPRLINQTKKPATCPQTLETPVMHPLAVGSPRNYFA